MNALTRYIVRFLTMLYAWILRPLYKSLVDWATGMTELERVVDKASKAATSGNRIPDTCRALVELEEFLEDSSDPKYKEILACRDLERVAEFSQHIVASSSSSSSSSSPSTDAAAATSKSSQMSETLSSLLPYLFSYNDLVIRVELLRQTAFDSNDERHEAELTTLWKHLQPDRELTSRLSADWGDVGFQGEDPKTDFRGMGMLGLRNISFFAAQDTFQPSARRTLLRSHHPQFWYSWAIVGINLTSLCHDFLKRGLLKESIYASAVASSSSSSSSSSPPCLPSHFHALFCRVFIAFDEFWFRQEKSVMEFNSVREDFRLAFLRQLRGGNLADEALEIAIRE